MQEVVSLSRGLKVEAFARILPSAESLRTALASGLQENRLAVLKPLEDEPIGVLESALCRHWGIQIVVCRQSGGLTQQLWQNLCEDMKISLWLIARPSLDSGVEVSYSLNSLLERITIF